MKAWLLWWWEKQNVENILNKLQVLTHPGFTYASIAYGVGQLLYAIGGYMINALPVDQALSHIQQGVVAMFFTAVSSPLARKD